MKKAVVVYWSGTGNTEIMAEKIKEGLEEASYEVDLLEVYEALVDEVLEYDKIAFGCSSMGIEELEEEEFEPFFEEIESHLADRKIALFGSYGWGDGEWMEYWEDRVSEQGALLFEKGLIINSTPSTDEEEDCVEFGKRFGEF
ncbi:MAG TPA: flavodoxin [Haploplasma sp.]|nr:flavodoxin [Haploplasma sp.]